MSPLQSPPDPFTQLLYKIVYFVRGLWYKWTDRTRQ